MSDEAVRAETVLRRYPDISADELDYLIGAMRRLPLLAFGMIAADDTLGRKLDRLYADHGDRLRPPLSGAAWALAIPAAIVLAALFYTAVT